LENRTKSNEQLFTEYYDIIEASLSNSYCYEARRLLEKFRAFLGNFPPSTALAVKFLGQFKARKPNTRLRYTYIVSAFFNFYSGERLPIKIKVPKIIPQDVPLEDFERLESTILAKKTHKKSIGRDIHLIQMGRMTGLRAGELANLKVRDLQLKGDDPIVIVHEGKGAKDRVVPLNPYLREKLASFTASMSRDQSLFGLTRKTISMKTTTWSTKAGVPHIHAHSMRHHLATTLLRDGVSLRVVQEILGHESLDTTMRYLHVTGQEKKEAMGRLDPRYRKPSEPGSGEWVVPLSYSLDEEQRKKLKKRKR
jgi:integrase/recombinase XerD